MAGWLAGRSVSLAVTAVERVLWSTMRIFVAVCGTRPAHHESLLRVVGGEEVTPGTWPWMASLHGGSDEKFFCGASVIAPQWVLTAGHCVGGG